MAARGIVWDAPWWLRLIDCTIMAFIWIGFGVAMHSKYQAGQEEQEEIYRIARERVTEISFHEDN